MEGKTKLLYTMLNIWYVVTGTDGEWLWWWCSCSQVQRTSRVQAGQWDVLWVLNTLMGINIIVTVDVLRYEHTVIRQLCLYAEGQVRGRNVWRMRSLLSLHTATQGWVSINSL